jgi:osmotically-inducible protein OsmY
LPSPTDAVGHLQGRKAVSDRSLERGILELLKARHIGGLTIWEVHAHEGIATVRGRAESPFAKRACRECCRHVTGVRGVIDQIELG